MGLLPIESGQQLFGHDLAPDERIYRDPDTGQSIILVSDWLPSAKAVEAPVAEVVETVMEEPQQLFMAASGLHREAEAHQAQAAA